MFQNRLFNIALIIIISIAMLGVVAIVGLQYIGSAQNQPKAPKPVAADKLAATQFQVEKITTNLAGSSLIQIQVYLQVDGSKAMDELNLRKVQVKDTITQILHTTTHVDLQKTEGVQLLKQHIKDAVNQYLQNGKVIDVYIPDIVIQ
ncbi:flagellar basal body-associated FliL family protein [Effusibacillus dendaii]|uniref:Flagellar protein FliL n=1 Tax=Effusibacillus dendaii TaxID=2743772 RepID=A0A7I8D8C5_9BACL|nr:flagellar basal body-associated FliL family protein [Effusibacillus dendaii]BCJ85269.1 hypothetical protein skT53_02540 [Effusibacillus dendaii]